MASCTDICRSILIERLVCNVNTNASVSEEFVDHKNYVFNLLKSTVLNGENNSALIIGARGSGKTMVCLEYNFCWRNANAELIASNVITVNQQCLS